MQRSMYLRSAVRVQRSASNVLIRFPKISTSASSLRWCCASSDTNPSRSTTENDRRSGANLAAAAVLLKQHQQMNQNVQSSSLHTTSGMTSKTNSNSIAGQQHSRGASATIPATNDGALPMMTTTEEVQETFRYSVEARTVSNAQLREYVLKLPAKDYALAVAAVTGAKAGGLRVTAHTYEALLDCLAAGGQLGASMELYQQMLRQRMAPTAKTYASLMEICLERDMPKGCQSLFKDMEKRGVHPNPQTYQLMIESLAAENPPQWETAVRVFDRACHDRKEMLTAETYNALMIVYMNMEPFDWRVVYNCYHEMREREPRIPLQWKSYLILREAMKRGGVGYIHRFMAYIDAWMAVTPLRSWDFLWGALTYAAVLSVVKIIISLAACWAKGTMFHPQAGESILAG